MNLQMPSLEQQIFIRQAVNEDVNTRHKDLEAIKEWLRKEPHLPDVWDDTLIMNFLRSCNFSLEKTKRKLDRYFTMKAAVPEFFTGYDITKPEEKKILSLVEIGTMPKMTAQGRRVHVGRFVISDFDAFDFSTAFKMFFMLGQMRFKLEELGTSGDIYILEANNAILKRVLKVSPILVKKFFVCALAALPLKVKEVHIVNPTPVIELVLKFVKPLLKEKIFNRVHLHKELSTLHEYVPKGLLPEEFGGAAGKLKTYMDGCLVSCRQFEAWFKQQEIIKADESKRVGKSLHYEELFGLPGSFKQLSID